MGKDIIYNFEPLFNKWRIFNQEDSNSNLYKVINKNKETAIVKFIYMPKTQSQEAKRIAELNIQQFEDEVKKIMSLENKQNILSYIQYDVKEDKFAYYLMILMEDIKKLNIDTHITNEDDIINLAKDISSSLEVLHNNNILHRDINENSIFVDTQKINNSLTKVYKLGNFQFCHDFSSANTKIGSYEFIVPEVYKGLDYDNRLDIYSLGLTLYTIINGQIPFLQKQSYKPSEYDKAIDERINGTPLPVLTNISSDLNNIILKACKYDPNERYQSIIEMKNELDKIGNNSEVSIGATQILNAAEAIFNPIKNNNMSSVQTSGTISNVIKLDKIDNNKKKSHSKKRFNIFKPLISISLIVLIISSITIFYTKFFNKKDTNHNIGSNLETKTPENEVKNGYIFTPSTNQPSLTPTTSPTSSDSPIPTSSTKPSPTTVKPTVKPLEYKELYIIKNPGAENKNANWYVIETSHPNASYRKYTENSRTGEYALKVENFYDDDDYEYRNFNKHLSLCQDIPTTPNKRYKLECYIETHDMNGKAYVDIDNDTHYTSTTNHDWKKVSFEFIAKDPLTSIIVGINTEGNVYFDDFKIYEKL